MSSVRKRGNPNNPYGGRKGGDIYTDYDVGAQQLIPVTPIFRRGNFGCDYQYTTQIMDAQFRFNQCSEIAESGGSLLSSDEMYAVCQTTLNEDLVNAQNNFGVCRNLRYR